MTEDRSGAAITHGSHCPCSACAREDWTKIEAPCGMHGESCPREYQPVSSAPSMLRDQDLFRVVYELCQRASALTESYAPSTLDRPARLVMLGDAGVMEWAASVIEGAINDAK